MHEILYHIPALLVKRKYKKVISRDSHNASPFVKYVILAPRFCGIGT